MYWSWHPEVRQLFARIDRRQWLNFRSPVAVLRVQRDWTSLLNDPDFMVQYETVLRDFDLYMANGREHWFAREHGDELDGPVAYFCAEYGLQESLPIYSGGLGVLAGDHCKTASDMALPSRETRMSAEAALRNLPSVAIAATARFPSVWLA